MELVVNLEDLSDLAFVSSRGDRYRLVKEDDLRDFQSMQLTNARNQFITQKQLLKELKIGYQKVKQWEIEGLPFVYEGRSKLYDLEEVIEFRKRNKL